MTATASCITKHYHCFMHAGLYIPLLSRNYTATYGGCPGRRHRRSSLSPRQFSPLRPPTLLPSRSYDWSCDSLIFRGSSSSVMSSTSSVCSCNYTKALPEIWTGLEVQGTVTVFLYMLEMPLSLWSKFGSVVLPPQESHQTSKWEKSPKGIHVIIWIEYG